jgi:hypothetical protein
MRNSKKRCHSCADSEIYQWKATAFSPPKKDFQKRFPKKISKKDFQKRFPKKISKKDFQKRFPSTLAKKVFWKCIDKKSTPCEFV